VEESGDVTTSSTSGAGHPENSKIATKIDINATEEGANSSLIGTKGNIVNSKYVSKTQVLEITRNKAWHYYITIWHCRNGELHGHIFEESRQKALEMKRQKAQAIYTGTEGTVTEAEARLLHRDNVVNILNWTKAHLNAYLATAEVILEQNVDPG